jgi:CBS domain containing-hemolysin-like protein
MTIFFIKIILWMPFFIIALILGAIGNLLNRIPYIFFPLVWLLFKLSNFILNLVIKDLVHSAKGTLMEEYITNIINNISNKK